MIRIVNFQPAFMDFHIVDGEAPVDHFLNEVCEIQFGDILRLLKPSRNCSAPVLLNRASPMNS